MKTFCIALWKFGKELTSDQAEKNVTEKASESFVDCGSNRHHVIHILGYSWPLGSRKEESRAQKLTLEVRRKGGHLRCQSFRERSTDRATSGSGMGGTTGESGLC